MPAWMIPLWSRPRRARGRLAAVALALAMLLPSLVVPMPHPAAASPSAIKLPFDGSGAWYVWEGYRVDPARGGTHWNCDPATGRDDVSHSISCVNREQYQYKYSFDLRRVDERTDGQAVLSPAYGTISWIDQDFGGMAIDIGDGYIFAYFHTRLDPGLSAGDAVARGQFLGTVAAPGERGNGGVSHLHINLWRSDDGGNASRRSIPRSPATTCSTASTIRRSRTRSRTTISTSD